MFWKRAGPRWRADPQLPSAGLPGELRKGLEQLPEMIAFFSERFGSYPFDAYGVVIVNSPEFSFVAMETQALSQHAQTLSALSENILAHELAHQWFGTASAWRPGRTSGSRRGRRPTPRGCGRSTVKAPRLSISSSVVFIQPRAGLQILQAILHRAIYNTTTIYDRGAMTFHALRLRLGDEMFFRLLRDYTERFRYGNAAR